MGAGVGMGMGSDWASPSVLRTSHPKDTGRPGQGLPKVREALGHIVTLTDRPGHK